MDYCSSASFAGADNIPISLLDDFLPSRFLKNVNFLCLDFGGLLKPLFITNRSVSKKRKNAQSLVNMLLSFSRLNRLP